MKHSHYHKDVSNLKMIDVYRVLALYAVTDPCIQHAIKKLLVAGGRGAGKDISQDIQEAIDSLERWKDMRKEETTPAIVKCRCGYQAPLPAKHFCVLEGCETHLVADGGRKTIHED